ncbi:hypothetical protein [Rhodoferax sp.]|uniref:hypothetical protein n=1 Tax=Rhodoferax sp. TaxID=50421 RepID=UPI002749E4D3|nr:hypothetical protein [Rhodoferax sp.]
MKLRSAWIPAVIATTLVACGGSNTSYVTMAKPLEPQGFVIKDGATTFETMPEGGAARKAVQALQAAAPSASLLYCTRWAPSWGGTVGGPDLAVAVSVAESEVEQAKAQGFQLVLDGSPFVDPFDCKRFDL